MKISSLIAAVGDDNIGVQGLDQCLTAFNYNAKSGTRITFGTDEAVNTDGTVKLGLILWMPRAVVEDAKKHLAMPAPAEVEGWQMVPKEPTSESCRAVGWRSIFGASIYERYGMPQGDVYLTEFWQAMLDQAPSPPASPAAGPGLRADDYARGLSDGLRQAAEVVANMEGSGDSCCHSFQRAAEEAISNLALIPK